MTEDTSPENLRKFLESDDPAMVRMGLSMAKGSGVPDNLLGEILWMYMMHGDKTIRAAARSTFMKIAPEDTKLIVKENWKASYRTDGCGDDKCVRSPACKAKVWGECKLQLSILGKALCQTPVNLVNPLIKVLGKKNEIDRTRLRFDRNLDLKYQRQEKLRRNAVNALGEIGDKRAVEPLIRVCENYITNTVAAKEALRKLGHEVE